MKPDTIVPPMSYTDPHYLPDINLWPGNSFQNVQLSTFHVQTQIVNDRMTVEKKLNIKKWHGTVVSMLACGRNDPGSNPCIATVGNVAIFFLGVFMIQFNLI